jgi:hypothetical protein
VLQKRAKLDCVEQCRREVRGVVETSRDCAGKRSKRHLVAAVCVSLWFNDDDLKKDDVAQLHGVSPKWIYRNVTRPRCCRKYCEVWVASRFPEEE